MYAPHDHEESIYNLVAPRMLEPVRPPMYRSKHNWSRPASASTFHGKSTSNPLVSNLSGDAADKIVPDKDKLTFGKPIGFSRSEPSKYLGKGTRSFSVPSLREVKQKNPDQLRPKNLRPLSKGPTPRTKDMPIMNLVTSKNFVVANAVEVILAPPRRRITEEKDYLQKEDYGQPPKYLEHIKQDIQNEYEYIRAMDLDVEDANKPATRELEEDERQMLIEGVKKKWEKVNHAYQHHTHLTKYDGGMKLKKEKWDAELQNLEKDLEKLSKKKIIIDMES